MDTPHEDHTHQQLDLFARLEPLGYAPDENAFRLTWADLAECLSEVLFRRGLELSTLSDEELERCMEQGAQALADSETLPWQWSAQQVMEANLFPPPVEPDWDDEGPLTEQYELWSRAEDGWLEAAYEDRFYLDE